MLIYKRSILSKSIHFGLLIGIASIANAKSTGSNSLPSVELDTINVYSDTYRTTGTKSKLEPEEAPLSYNRLDQQTLEERQANTVNKALRYEPGVSSESRGTVTLFDEYRIRGFETSVNYYDGMRLASDGVWNLRPQVDAYATEAVEIVKGSASSLYGFGSSGGLVNQVAKTPKSISEHEAKVKIGTGNLKEIAIDSTGSITDAINYRVVALGRKKDGQMKTTEEKRIMVNPSLEIKQSDKLDIVAGIYYQDDPEQLPSTPLHSQGTVYNTKYGKLGSDAYAGDVWNHYEKKVLMPSLNVNLKVSDSLSLKHASRYTKAEGIQRNIYNQGLLSQYKTAKNKAIIDQYFPNNNTLLIRDAYTTDEKLKNLTTDNQLAFKFDTGDIHHNALFGIEYQKTDSEVTYKDAGAIDPNNFTIYTPPLDMANPDYYLIDPKTLPLNNKVQHDDIEQKQIGYYLQDEVVINDLTLVTGVRYDDFKSINNQTITGKAAKQIINEDKVISGRLATIYNLKNGISPFVSYSESFNPVIGESYVDGSPFKATTADQLEAGFKYQDDKTQASFAGYKIVQENVKVAAADYTKQTQTGSIESQGFEMSFSQVVNDWLDLSASYSMTNTKITKDQYNPDIVGNAPPQVAKYKANLWVDVYPTDKVKLNAGVRYQSGVNIDKQNSDTLPAVTLVDIGGQYNINNALSVGISVNNAFDKVHVSSCYDKSNCWMGSGREASISLSAKF